MLNFDLYAIYTEVDECRGSIKEFFTSFDEAKENRFKYANWCRPRGDVWIKRYDANDIVRDSHTWHINENGDIISEYDWKRYYD